MILQRTSVGHEYIISFLLCEYGGTDSAFSTSQYDKSLAHRPDPHYPDYPRETGFVTFSSSCLKKSIPFSMGYGRGFSQVLTFQIQHDIFISEHNVQKAGVIFGFPGNPFSPSSPS